MNLYKPHNLVTKELYKSSVTLINKGKKVTKSNILAYLVACGFLLEHLGNAVLANLEGSKCKISPLRPNHGGPSGSH